MKEKLTKRQLESRIKELEENNRRLKKHLIGSDGDHVSKEIVSSLADFERAVDSFGKGYLKDWELIARLASLNSNLTQEVFKLVSK